MKKLLKWCCLCLTISFLGFGILYRSMSHASEGINVRSGAYIGEKYVELDSGNIGGDEEKVKSFNQGGTAFFILAGVTGVATIVAFVKDKRSK